MEGGIIVPQSVADDLAYFRQVNRDLKYDPNATGKKADKTRGNLTDLIGIEALEWLENAKAGEIYTF